MLPVSTPRLFGVTELGAALGWDRRKVGVYLLRGRLPQPAVRLACGPIWTGEQVDELLRQRGGVDADNKGAEAPPGHPAPAEHPPDPAAGLRPGRVFFHRQWTWADGRPRQCVVETVAGGDVRFRLLPVTAQAPLPERAQKSLDNRRGPW